MNITILHGTQRRGSTYTLIHQIVDQLDPQVEPVVTEFFLPQAMPHFCAGCYTCIFSDEQKCPHAASVHPIREALLAADLIIIGSPVYVFDVSGQLKALFDHFGYAWMSHRPEASMFGKVGLSVVTGAGAGMTPTTKTIQTNLQWWGVGRRFQLKHGVMASSYREIPASIKQQLDKKTAVMAKKISKALVKRQQPSWMTRVLFGVMRLSKKGHPEWNAKDHAYWQSQGYFEGNKPWKIGKA